MPDLNDAIALLKAGDDAGARRLMNQIVGLPADTPMQTPMRPVPSARDAVQPGMLRGKPVGPAQAGPMPSPMQGGAPTPGQFRAAANAARMRNRPPMGGRPFAKGGSVGSASKRADGCAQRGKTKGKML